MVFQFYALFPHLTVAENVAFGLRIRKVPAAEVRRRVGEALELVQLSHLADRLPRTMSGGQQQRVALARAVVIRPGILLLDEPLGALDLKLRQELQVEIKRVQQTLGITTLYVTHDQSEALSLSDRIAVMQSGRVLQLDGPIELYEQPNSAYVANFIGRTNLLDTEVLAYDGTSEIYTVRSVVLRDLTFKVKRRSNSMTFDPGAPCLLGFRPERASLDGDKVNRLPARIEKSTYYGSTWSIALSSAVEQAISVEHKGAHIVPVEGERVDLRWGETDCFLLPKEAS
jgi:ABC-type Fe3+/spermidine/putrescine transport system ATPase subunit